MTPGLKPTSVTTSRADRALGALYGVALGDAMGMPGELWSRRHIQQHFGRIEHFLPGPDGHFVVDGFRAGQVTDDTQQMVMLAESIIGSGGRVVIRELARDLVAWADRVGASDGHFLGPTSAKVIQRLREGANPADTGVAGTTNGAAMRIAPIGVLCPSSDLEQLLVEVEASCLIAHNTGVAIAGAALVATAISTAVDVPPGTSRRDAVGQTVRAAIAAANLAASRGIDAPSAAVGPRAAMAVELASRNDRDDDEFLQTLYDVVGSGTESCESVPAALALVVRSAGDPLACALLAANLGGDTDTIGAMAVSVAGAIAGFGAIPEDVVKTLVSVNGLRLEPLAENLLQLRDGRDSSRQRKVRG